MKMNAKYFRDTAWSELKGKWGQAALFTFMYMIISGALRALGIMDDLVGGLLSIFVLLFVWIYIRIERRFVLVSLFRILTI